MEERGVWRWRLFRGAQVSDEEKDSYASLNASTLSRVPAFLFFLGLAELGNRTAMLPKVGLSDHTRKFVVILPMML